MWVRRADCVPSRLWELGDRGISAVELKDRANVGGTYILAGGV